MGEGSASTALDKFNTQALPDVAASVAIHAAAHWLAEHRDEINEPLFPFICKRWSLTNREALTALHLARALKYAGKEQ